MQTSKYELLVLRAHCTFVEVAREESTSVTAGGHWSTSTPRSQIHSKQTQIFLSPTCTFQPLRVKSEVMPWWNANKPIVPEINVPWRPPQNGLWIFQKASEYDRSALDSKQEDNTPEPPTLALANGSLRRWLNGINSGTGSALPWHWVCVRECTLISMTNSEAQGWKKSCHERVGGVAQPFNQIQILRVESGGQTARRSKLFRRGWMSCWGSPSETGGTLWPNCISDTQSFSLWSGLGSAFRKSVFFFFFKCQYFFAGNHLMYFSQCEKSKFVKNQMKSVKVRLQTLFPRLHGTCEQQRPQLQ